MPNLSDLELKIYSKKVVKKLEEGKRADGRKPQDLRQIKIVCKHANMQSTVFLSHL